MADAPLSLANLGADVPLPRPRPGPFEQALGEYPVLKSMNLVPKYNIGQGGDNMLEFWPSGEPGSSDRPRPTDIPLERPGVEIYSNKTRPIDVLGDAVSHQLISTDPNIKAYYSQFVQSLGPQQKALLRRQYVHARQNAGETRPYSEWEASSGLPAYFRGYAFQQWPDDFNEQAYTPDQRAMFDQMMRHLQRREP